MDSCGSAEIWNLKVEIFFFSRLRCNASSYKVSSNSLTEKNAFHLLMSLLRGTRQECNYSEKCSFVIRITLHSYAPERIVSSFNIFCAAFAPIYSADSTLKCDHFHRVSLSTRYIAANRVPPTRYVLEHRWQFHRSFDENPPAHGRATFHSTSSAPRLSHAYSILRLGRDARRATSQRLAAGSTIVSRRRRGRRRPSYR